MKKRILAIFLCIVMIAAVMAGLTACYDDDSDGCVREQTEEQKLASDVKKINEMIEACCLESRIVTYEQLKTALASFYYIQEKYSGAKLREIDGVTYRCPHFVLDWENKDSADRENVMYIITPLAKNEIGIYPGIKVTPYYMTETAEKIDEMNKKLNQFLIITTNKFKVDEMAERFKAFQEEYSGKVLCVDPVLGEVRCPDYQLEIKPISEKYLSEGIFYDSYVVVWQANLKGKNKDGFITGIRVIVLSKKVSDDYTAKAGEFLTVFKKVIKNENAYNVLGERLTPYETWIRIETDNTKKP